MGQKRSRPPKGAAKNLWEETDHGLTVVVADALLLAAFESGVEERTVAVFVRLLFGAALTFTVSVSTTGGSAGRRVPMTALTVPF
jgi:hypothetical protein